MMEKKELKKEANPETELRKLREKLAELRTKRALGSLPDGSQIRQTRREIARVLTSHRELQPSVSEDSTKINNAEKKTTGNN